jgi:hypothetical protein
MALNRFKVIWKREDGRSCARSTRNIALVAMWLRLGQFLPEPEFQGKIDRRFSSRSRVLLNPILISPELYSQFYRTNNSSSTVCNKNFYILLQHSSIRSEGLVYPSARIIFDIFGYNSFAFFSASKSSNHAGKGIPISLSSSLSFGFWWNLSRVVSPCFCARRTRSYLIINHAFALFLELGK